MSNKTRNILIAVAALVIVAAAVLLIISNSTSKTVPGLPAETVIPEVTEAPAETAAPEVTEAPAETAAPEITEAPAETEAPEETAAPAAEATEAPAGPVLLATVNGEEIRTDNAYLTSLIAYNMDYAQYYGYDIESKETIDMINQYSMYYTIRDCLIRQKAAELGLDKFTDEELADMETKAKAEWSDIVGNYVSESGTVTDTSTEEEKAAARADAEAELKSMGYDEPYYINEYRENVVTTRLTDYLSAGSDVTDEDVRAYFDDLVKEDQETYGSDVGMYEFYTQYYGQNSYYRPEGYRSIVHILLPVQEELMNDWKDLSARLEEQQSEKEAETVAETEAAEEPAEETPAEETPAPEAPAEATPEPEAEPTEEATPEPEAEPTEEASPEPTAEPVTQAMVDAAKDEILSSVQATVDEIMAKLESGVSFDDLIREYGTDTGMKDDATRAAGYPVHKDSIIYDQAFTDAAMALEKVGDVSKPFVSQFGVHILQYLKDIPGGAVELTEEMKAEFRDTLLSEIRNEKLNTALEQWVTEADIVYTEAGKSWKVPEEPEEEAAEEETPASGEPEAEAPVTEAPAAEVPAAEEPAQEEKANP